ncbi:MAG: Re/Si-specific NAD(P)(+) transhydrogenase subunit alpha [Planctomycetes bacterium]|nr:Re/Si-specific NAD(P)(+) transhydrogenase subunit alpha [Planctomycetota bacterium]
MRIAVPRESHAGERRVALVPTNVPSLAKAGLSVVVEAGAGIAAGFPDAAYQEKGASVVEDRRELFATADVVVQVRTPGANPTAGDADLAMMRRDQLVVGLGDPLGDPESARRFAATGAALLALELIPRITRAQAMDVLSSQATIAGYRAVLLAALELPRMFPLMMTAAGTLTAAKVFVIGAGVAGLQAIATSRRLGGVVHAYDVRPACREQVQSLGARFVEVPMETGGAEDKGGYAAAMSEDFYRKQRALMTEIVAASDVVITTAAIPGKRSPVLVTTDAVRKMAPGCVIVDLAAERGGNCELSRPDERVVDHGVVILGPTNPASDVPGHASLMYGNNATRFLLNMTKDQRVQWNPDDEICRETLVARGGEVVHPRVRERLSPPATGTAPTPHQGA